MSQESDTPKDSKPVRLKLTKKVSKDTQAPMKMPEIPKEDPVPPPAIDFGPREDPEPEASAPSPGAEATPETPTSEPKPISFTKREEPKEEEPAPQKKQIPLKRKKPKADPLLDPDIEIAFAERPKLKPKTPESTPAASTPAEPSESEPAPNKA